MNFKVKCVGYNKDEKCFTIGKVYDVCDGVIVSDRAFKYGGYNSFEELYKWFKRWYEFELVKEDHPEIHITVKGNETIAVYKNGTEYKKAVAKCSPEDTFDFGGGAKLALERLGVLPTTEPVVEDKPLKLVCVYNNYNYGTVGEPTGYKDIYGKPLYVGDVVSVWDKYLQKDCGKVVIVYNNAKYFVCGIESACNDKKWTIEPNWVITKVKDHSEMKRRDLVDSIEYT